MKTDKENLKNSKQEKIVFVFITLLFAAAVAILLIASAREGTENGRVKKYEDFSKGWVNEDGEEVNLGKLTESCTIHKIVPDIDSDRMFGFNARNIDVEVFIDGVSVYKNPKPEDAFLKAFYGKTAGSVFVETRIPYTASGKIISIEVTNPYSNASSCKIVNMFFGDGMAIVKREAALQLGSFCLSVIILFLGVICIVLYIPLDRHRMSDIGMLYLGLSAFTFGMSMLTDCKLLQVIVGHETLYYTVSQMFMALIPMPLLLFFDRLYGSGNKIPLMIVCGLGIADFIVSLALDLTGIADYHDSAVSVVIVCGAAIIYVGAVTLIDIIKNGGGRNRFHNAGVVILIISSILDAVSMQSDSFVETSFFMRVGLAAFFSMECAQIIWKYVTGYQKGVKAQLVSRLAYHDGLTDMLNRTSFMEDIEKSVIGRNEDILIAVFDVNNLKYVNDTFWHTCGDALIIAASEAISESFGEMGKCYRTGGDEFVLIANYENAEKRFLSGHEKMTEMLKKAEENAEYPISAAAGYAVMSNDFNSLKELFNKADERMYENKKIMKEKNPIAAAAR